MKLTNDNYFSIEANKEYMSASQFKDFLSCEARALAKVHKLFSDPPSKALLIGSYVDSFFSGEMPEFTINHPEIFNSRTGELKKDFVKADKLIERAQRDKLFMKFLDGEKQTIMTGELFGHMFKIKMDSYFPGDKIVDLKVIKDMKPIYKNSERKNFMDAWGYDIQGYIYQQIVKANTGEELPFYLAVLTKEDPADMEIIHIPQWKLNSASAIIEHYVDRFVAVKNGELEPKRCGVCDYCRETKKLTSPVEYEDIVEADF